MLEAKDYNAIFNAGMVYIREAEIQPDALLKALHQNILHHHPSLEMFYQGLIDFAIPFMANYKILKQLVHHSPFHGLKMGRDCGWMTRQRFPTKPHYASFMALCGLYHDIQFTKARTTNNGGADEIASAEHLYCALKGFFLEDSGEQIYLKHLINVIIIGGTYPDCSENMIRTPAQIEKQNPKRPAHLTDIDTFTQIISDCDLDNIPGPKPYLPHLAAGFTDNIKLGFEDSTLLRLTQSARVFQEDFNASGITSKSTLETFITRENKFCALRLAALQWEHRTVSDSYKEWAYYSEFLETLASTTQSSTTQSSRKSREIILLLQKLAAYPETQMDALQEDLLKMFVAFHRTASLAKAWGVDETKGDTPSPKRTLRVESQLTPTCWQRFTAMLCCCRSLPSPQSTARRGSNTVTVFDWQDEIKSVSSPTDEFDFKTPQA